MASLQAALLDAGIASAPNATPHQPSTPHLPAVRVEGMDATQLDKLDSSVASISLRFVLRRKNEIAPAIWHDKNCQVIPSADQQVRAPGVQFIEPTKKTSLLAFVDEVKQLGFNLTNIRTKEWTDKVTGGSCQSVVFVLGRGTPNAAVADTIEQYGISSLMGLVAGTAWTVEAYRNPFEVGRVGISINAAACKRTEAVATLRIRDNTIEVG